MVKSELATRKLGRSDAGRMAIVFAFLVGIFAVWYFVLPAIRALFSPTASGGDQGPWVVWPIIAIRFCACAVLTAVSVPLAMQPLRRRWLAQDIAAGSCYDPYRKQPFRKACVYLAGSALLVIYGAALVFYVSWWDIVGPAGITEHGPFGSKTHSFDQIRSLEVVSKRMRRDDDHLVGDGPWHRVEFIDGRSYAFGRDNEGWSEAEESAIAEYIAEKSKQTWYVREKAR
jgi:hypothetical protein